MSASAGCRNVMSAIVLAALLPVVLAACAQAPAGAADPALRGGMVVVLALAPGAAEKIALVGTSDSGQLVFRSAGLGPHNGQTSSYGGQAGTLPRWVRVSWRDRVVQGAGDEYFNAGKLLGSHQVAVRERIPAALLSHIAQAPGRALVLRFRIKDDAVLLAWDVQERSANGQGWNYSLHGGDFLDPTLDNGKVVDPGWERPAQ